MNLEHIEVSINITMSKFKKYDTLLETAFAYYSNGGFREGTPVRVNKSFLSSPYFKKHYSGDESFVAWLTDLIERNYFFFIKRVVGQGAQQDVKDANDNSGAGDCYLILKMDPRTVQTPTELAEFTVPGDWAYIEVVKSGNNLPPLQGVPNKYELPVGTKPEVAPDYFNIDNQPTDKSLPKVNVNINIKK
jgi:hypothetical protein